MAQPKRIPPKTPSSKGGKSRVKKTKQPTQHPPQQRVMVLGPTGKRRFEWRPW
jgi:hypothetical protein